MIVSLKWLRNYVDFSFSVEELADHLTMVGLEVEAVRRLYPFLNNVITVRLDAIMPHPKADRLRLCDVSDGSKSYRVVCGAPNLFEGDILVLALPGAQTASGMLIRESEIRGQPSQGMLCSQKELSMGDDASGLWVLPAGTSLGAPLAEVLGVEDTILDLSVTPNRGDCLSIIGIAREVAAMTGSVLKYPAAIPHETGTPVGELASVEIVDPQGCPRYTARVVEGVTVGPSPAWLRQAVEAVGIRSINNIVDVTNFILMELGQPLHAFDYDRLREHRIVVRRAREGERFTTLDGVERTLFADTLLICDGEGPVAIAGIMGGQNSEIVTETKRVLIESACFDPTTIRRTGKKIGLRSESSYRFERGVDPEGALRAVDRAAQLMQEVGGGFIAGGCIDEYPRPYVAPVLDLRVERTNRFLGTGLDASEMAGVLRGIEMRVDELDGGRLRVTVPPFRPDITREVDLTEEVARLIGYDRIPVTSPHASVDAEPIHPHMKSRQAIKDLLKGAGFFEVINYSFVSEDWLKKLRLSEDDSRLKPVRVKNPLSEDQAVMRTSLVPGLLQTARYNFDHRNEDLRIFELSKVFLPVEGQPLPEEPHHLAGALAGRRFPDPLYGDSEAVDYADAKGCVEEILELFHVDGLAFCAGDVPSYFDPVRAASICVGKERVGAVGRIHPAVEEAFDLKQAVFLFEVDFDRVFQLRQPKPLFQPLPKYPSVVRDMALVLDESVPAGDPLGFVVGQRQPLLEGIEVFDIYRSEQLGEGRKSVAYRLVYRALDRSLTDEEVNEIHQGLVAGVLSTFQAILR